MGGGMEALVKQIKSAKNTTIVLFEYMIILLSHGLKLNFLIQLVEAKLFYGGDVFFIC